MAYSYDRTRNAGLPPMVMRKFDGEEYDMGYLPSLAVEALSSAVFRVFPKALKDAGYGHQFSLDGVSESADSMEIKIRDPKGAVWVVQLKAILKGRRR